MPLSEQKKIILVGAGLTGKAALDFYGADRVYCFADNFKAGETFCGKNVIGFEELTKIHPAYSVVISMVSEIAEQVEKQCRKSNIPVVLWLETISLFDFESRPEIAQFKNAHQGERCFLIGNGPSLRVEDINRLQDNGVSTFGCNNIYKLYDHTLWRPTYYFVTDLIYLNYHLSSIVKSTASTKFVPVLEKFYAQDRAAAKVLLTSAPHKTYFFNKISPARTGQQILFSEDPSRGLYESATVMYIMLQMSAYMGYKEIFLLGVDNTILGDQPIHFYEEEPTQSNTVFTISNQAGKRLLANGYQAAEQYARAHGFRIYNATRGGCLETFERVDFDNLF